MRVHRGLQRHTAIEHVWDACQRVLAVRARPVGRKRAMRLAGCSRRHARLPGVAVAGRHMMKACVVRPAG
eukprot:5829705-Prymnesium_polylepis.1